MFSFKVTSRNRIEELRRELRPRAGRAINEWARSVLAVAQQLAPYDEGELRASGEIVNYANTRGDGRQSGVAKAIRFTAAHSLFQELGTSEQPAQPYLRPAYEMFRQQLLDDLARIAKL